MKRGQLGYSSSPRSVHQVMRGGKISSSQVANIERDIDNFLETFRKKSSVLDDYNLHSQNTLTVPAESSHGSSQSLTDENTDDSPDKAYFLGVPQASVHMHRRQFSNTTNTSESEWGPDMDDETMYHEGHHANVRNSEQYREECLEGMVEAVSPYSVLDVAQLLQSKFAYVSGGKAKNGAPIMTFPENPQHPDVSEGDYKKIVHYLCCIPPLHETEKGFVLVVDRREDNWGNVKSLLLRISNFFPKHVQVIFLLQPTGFFQRAFQEMKSKFVKEELEFKVVLCEKPEEILEHIDPSQLTTDVGGQLEFDALEWTQHRSAVEKFSTSTEKLAAAVTVMAKKYHEMEVPNSVKDMEHVMREHRAGQKEIMEDLIHTEDHGKTLLQCIKGNNERTPLIHQTHVLNLERLLVQLDETRFNFEKFWKMHERKLVQSLDLRRFEEDFKTFQFNAEKHIEEFVTEMHDVGESLQQVETMLQDFDERETAALKEIEQGEKMRADGEQLIVDDHYAVDSIRPKCVELQRMCEQYRQLLRRRREVLETSHDLQDRIEKANKWCSKGVDLLSNQHVEKCQKPEGAEQAVKDIESFITTSNQLRLNNPKEFRQLFDSIITPETRNNVQKTLKRIEDVQQMCSKRKESLNQVLRHSQSMPSTSSHREDRNSPTGHARQPRIRQPRANPRPPVVHSNHETLESKQQSLPDSPQKPIAILEKSARMRTHDLPGNRPYITPPISTGTSMSDSINGSDKPRSSLSSVSTTTSVGSSGLDIDTLLAKRSHVLNELIETEKTYVAQLEDIIKGYMYELSNRSMQHLVPEELFNKKDVLFGNLEDIYRFHKNIFLQELQNCRDNPAKVGKCFSNRKEEFHLYSIYCQNKLRSEALRNQVGDQNAFFIECQKRLGHKLPLGAYLLKPVQRITKYQLLLKELLRFTDNDRECEEQLQGALDSMLEVVRYVNDSMHQVSIVGYPGNLIDNGRLLMQGSFHVQTEHQNVRIKDIRFKPMQRHMFLYEKAILLCKRKEETGTNSEKGVYSFKTKLKLSQVGLTENIKGDRRRFELWLRGREEVYIIVAPNLAIKDLWVREIKRVLLNQFDQLKVNQLSILRRSEEDVSRMDSSSHRGLDSRRNPSRTSSVTSGSTIPQGIEMMSPESPPEQFQKEEEWSSGEYTDEEGEGEKQGEAWQYQQASEPDYLQKFVSVGDYDAADSKEIPLRKGDVVEIIKAGSTGWWFARHLLTHQEGWVPSTFLLPYKKHHSQSQVSVSSFDSSSQEQMTSKSSITSIYSTNSPVDETTI